MGTITSYSFDTRAGSGTISISHSSLSGGQNFEVSSIGSVEADFDLEDQSDVADNIYFKLGEFKFAAFDKMSDGNSLFEELDTLSATDEVDLSFDFTTNGSRSIADQYIFTIEDMEYKREKRETSIEGAVQITDGLRIGIDTFFSNEIGSSEDETFNSGASSWTCIDARTFINNALPLFNSSNTSKNLSNDFGDDGTAVPNAYVVVNDAQASGTNVDELLFEMAAAEGAKVGSIMGYNFYASRNNTDIIVNLSEDDVKELKIMPGLDVYNSISVTFEGTSQNYSTWISSNSQTYNTEAEKTLDVTFENNAMAWAEWNSTSGEYDDVGGDTGPPSGTFNYASAYGANKARRIELTIFGIDTLKPYEPLSLGSSFPSLVQGQAFHPSKLTYDFNNDIIEVEAYKI